MAALATKGDLDLWVNQTVDVDRANLLLDLASAVVRDIAGITIDSPAAPTVETVDGSGAPTVQLSEWPVRDVQQVTLDGDLLDDTGYAWTRDGILHRSPRPHSRWPYTPRAIVVTYEHGYDTVPDGIRHATLKIAGRLLRNPDGLRSESIGDWSASFADQGVAMADEDVEAIRAALR